VNRELLEEEILLILSYSVLVGGAMLPGVWAVALLLALAPATPQRAKESGENKRVLATYRIPFRLTETQHLLVRVKLNGKGPYNFIVDTGAPMLFVSKDVAKKIGVAPDASKVGIFERFELEGGAVLNKIPARIEDPMQLRGMNALGLAGTKLDGILGYNVLACFRMEIDLTQTAMIWHHLDYSPEAARPLPLEGTEMEKPPAGIANMERMANMMSMLLAKKGETTIRQRGFIGMELIEDQNGVIVQAVLAESPAAQAGLLSGDRITAIATSPTQIKPVSSLAELFRTTATVTAGKVVRFTISRGGAKREVSVTAGKGGF
jgi:hypothetical protein